MKTNVTMERRDGQNLRHQSAVGLLLLTLLAFTPLTGLSQDVINWNSTVGVSLNFYFAPDNSVTVEPGYTLNNTTTGYSAVFGYGYPWYLTNNTATLDGYNNGVHFYDGGTVDNQHGIIMGGNYGVKIGGDTGAVINTGFISGASRDGVRFWDGGTVDNEGSGSILGYTSGVKISGNTGSVYNAGSIIGQTVAGVLYTDYGGSVDNQSGTIQGGEYGVAIGGDMGYVTNYHGTITGTSRSGVRLWDGGTVDNEGGGSIFGGTSGVKVTSDTGSVYNAGSIIRGQTVDGVYMDSGGSVYNHQGGSIEGGQYGVEIAGTGYVTNHNGTISGDGNDGVYISGDGTVENKWGGSIFGNTNGVNVTGAGTVINAGCTSSIIGTNGDGVSIGGIGSVENKWGGSIVGQTGDGVYMGTNGSVENCGGGYFRSVRSMVLFPTNSLSLIEGYNNGVEIAGTGSVVNAGSIIGQTGNGVYMGAGGSVENDGEGYFDSVRSMTIPFFTSGLILGYTNGVEITGGKGTVINNGGSIYGYNNDGVYLGAGGIVVNEDTEYWSISGMEYGVEITGDMGYVTNYYAGIISTNHDGVRLRDGGTVDNEGYSAIEGGTSGIKITGGPGLVINDADEIIGDTKDGVYLGDGGIVDNRYGLIRGAQYGVWIDGGPGYVTNAGTIIGSNGVAISLGNYSNTVVLQTGSDVQGNIVGGTTPNDAAILQGDGSYSSNFVNFETLTVQADASGWNLTGTNGFSQSVTVSNGLLSINGGLTSSVVNVDITGSLGGTGTVFSIVNSHGVIAPGNSIGTVYIVGSLNMTNSTYDEQVNAAGNSDLISVSGSPGTAIVSNATVVVLLAHELYGSNTVYTNLTATGGVLGTNAGVIISNVPLFLTASLQYPDANTVETILHRSKFTSVANTYNQHSVAGALDGIADSPGAGMFNLVSNFFWLPTAGAARAALDSMSGEIHGSLGMLDVQQQDAFNNSIALRTGRISAGGESGGYASKPVQLASAGSALPPMQQQSASDQLLDNIWLQGFGTFGHLKGDGNASGGNFTVSGTSGGFDYRLSPEMLIGLAVGYSHDDATVGGPGASGTVDAIQCAAYGGYVSGPWHLDGIFSYGFLQTDTKRFIKVGSIHQEADGSYDGNVFSLSTEGGYVFGTDSVTIEPTVGLNYTYLSQNSFNETGIANDGHNYGLNVHSVDMNSLRTALGVRLAAQFGETNGVQFIPALRAAWEHEFLDKTADVNASFIGGSGDFIVRGVELGADSGVLGAGLTVAFNKALQGFVNYDARLNERISSHTVSGGLSYSW